MPGSQFKSFVVGIAGGTGSGKTTLARAICEELGSSNALILDQDSYYKDRSGTPVDHRKLINFDNPDAIDVDLFASQIEDLKCGRGIQKPIYDFVTHTRTRDFHSVRAEPVVLVDGILILAIKEVRVLFDIKIFVDTEPDVRLARRFVRDNVERGRTVESIAEQYLSTVRPMHQQFVEPSKKYADIILQENKSPEVVHMISRMIKYNSGLDAKAED